MIQEKAGGVVEVSLNQMVGLSYVKSEVHIDILMEMLRGRKS